MDQTAEQTELEQEVQPEQPQISLKEYLDYVTLQEARVRELAAAINFIELSNKLETLQKQQNEQQNTNS